MHDGKENPLVSQALKISIDGSGERDMQVMEDGRGPVTGYIDKVSAPPIDAQETVEDESGRLEFVGVPVNTGEPSVEAPEGIDPGQGSAEAVTQLFAPR